MRRTGRHLLCEVARLPGMEVPDIQVAVLWHLYRELLKRSTCTIMVGGDRTNGELGESVSFIIVDRWNVTINAIVLDRNQFERDLWQTRVDLMKGGRSQPSALEFVGKRRLSQSPAPRRIRS